MPSVYCLNSVIEHNLGRFPLGIPVSDDDPRIGNQPMAIVGERVSHATQTAGIVAFAVQARIGVGAGCMRVVAALLALEVAAVAIVLFTIFGHETLVASPSLNERAVHTEMLARKPVILLCGRQDQVEQ